MKKIDFFVITLSIFIISFGFFNLPVKVIGQVISSSSSSSSSGECIVCAQSIPECAAGQVVINQTCEECAHCGSCKCPNNQKFDPTQSKCIPKSDNEACIEIYGPVCGCDGMTYDNSCFAQVNGVKSFTNGICDDSINCQIDSDCPIGDCPNGTTYNAYSCLNGMCHQINYFADPCQFSSTSSGGQNTLLNTNFSGVWKGKLPRCRLPQGQLISSSSSGSCIACPLIQIFCAGGFFPVPDSCYECAHCEKCNASKVVTMRLCIKNGLIEGTVHQSRALKNARIDSQEIINENKVILHLLDKNGKTDTLTLDLLDNNLLSCTFGDGYAFEAKKLNQLKSCLVSNTMCANCDLVRCADPGIQPEGCRKVKPIIDRCKSCCEVIDCSSSSSGISNCGSRGNCRGVNGQELPCPDGTECSGLPAYGCYPPGCPVPICCSPDTRIRTNGEQKRIADITEGNIVLTDGERSVPVKKISKVEVKNHKILRVKLNDGITLEISPGHPTSDGRFFNDLKIGDIVDGRMVVETKLIPYTYKYTHDILPDSETGNYYANGILIGSTLAPHKPKQNSK